MADRDNSATVGAMMLLAGGVIGAGMALLFAPQTGKKTRRQISRYARKVRNESEEKIRDAAQAVTDMMENLGEKTADLVEKGSEVAEDWRKHLLHTIEQGEKNLERQKKRLTKMWG